MSDRSAEQDVFEAMSATIGQGDHSVKEWLLVALTNPGMDRAPYKLEVVKTALSMFPRPCSDIACLVVIVAVVRIGVRQ